MVRMIMMRLAVLLLAICRTLYCWIFFIFSWPGIYVGYTNILRMVRLHRIETVGIYSNIIIAFYSIVFGIAGWMILRGKPASKQWAIAANLVIVFTFVPALVTGHWRDVLKLELQWWPAILFGMFGIIIFNIPYHGWRGQPPIPVKCASQVHSEDL